MLLLVVVVLLGVTPASAMFYKACVENVTSFPVMCCPLYNGSMCGSSQNRGTCMPVQSSRAVSNPDMNIDDRDRFPSRYYSHICQCKGNFSGEDCGECRHNHEGNNCENVVYRQRREIRQLTVKERYVFLAQLHYCKHAIDPRYVILVSGDRFRSKAYEFQPASYYDVWCYVHNYITRQFINNTRENSFINFGHGSTGFLPWHRYYLIQFERSMRACTKDENFTAPYYDWRNDAECTICKDDFLGGNNDHGRISPYSIFSTWRSICSEYYMPGTLCLLSNCPCERPFFTRKPGALPGLTMPAKIDVDYCLNLTALDTPPYTSTSTRSFRNAVEGYRTRFETSGTSMHNLFHAFCGGTMSQVPIACNDPLFILHHCFIDKIWEVFIRKWNLTESSYPPNTIYGHQPTDCAVPFLPCRRLRDLCATGRKDGVTYSEFQNM